MTRTRGEGRSPAEKTQGVFTTAEYRKTQKARQKAEEEAWAAQSGPVTVTYTGIVEEEDSDA